MLSNTTTSVTIENTDGGHHTLLRDSFLGLYALVPEGMDPKVFFLAPVKRRADKTEVPKGSGWELTTGKHAGLRKK